jgi:S-adenosylmethionine-diacylgycerolhomoserine-N-methlytransferase
MHSMSFWSDLRVLYHLALKPVRGASHQERLESFYAGQAGTYDDFRRRLLQGRQELYSAIDIPAQGSWVDMGGGTGANLEYLADRIGQLRQVYVVDLSPSLLDVARQRSKERGWTNVQVCCADATTWQPPERVDVVTFSYSLTMIPDWFAAIDNGLAMLRPGGTLAVVDFYVSRKYPAQGLRKHGWFSRNFWPVWFGNDNVFPNADHLPYLQSRLETLELDERQARIPYLPLVRAPYYRFRGRKPIVEPRP